MHSLFIHTQAPQGPPQDFLGTWSKAYRGSGWSSPPSLLGSYHCLCQLSYQLNSFLTSSFQYLCYDARRVSSLAAFHLAECWSGSQTHWEGGRQLGGPIAWPFKLKLEELACLHLVFIGECRLTSIIVCSVLINNILVFVVHLFGNTNIIWVYCGKFLFLCLKLCQPDGMLPYMILPACPPFGDQRYGAGWQMPFLPFHLGTIIGPQREDRLGGSYGAAILGSLLDSGLWVWKAPDPEPRVGEGLWLVVSIPQGMLPSLCQIFK